MRVRSAGIILANWKNTPLTLRAARSIASQMEEEDHLVITGNGSDDDSLIVLHEGLDELRSVADPARVPLINTRANDSFGAGVTARAASLSGDAVVLLNSDATVCDGFLDVPLTPLDEAIGAMTTLVLLTGTWRPSTPSDMEFLVTRGGNRWIRVASGGSGGQIFISSTDNKADHVGNDYDRSWLGPADSPFPAPEVLGLYDGACAIGTDAWRVVGEVRTDPFMYYEDTDPSCKLREVGYGMHFVADAVVDHEYAASSGTPSPVFLQANARNRIVVAARHTLWDVVARAIARSIARAVHSGGRGPVTREILQGLLVLPHALRHRTASRPRR